jgi:hypothetical protein
MSRLRILFLSAATRPLLSISAAAQAQYYTPPPNRGYSLPPCQAVTPGPVQGAARGAAGGALIGAISGNAGRGAAIGAAFGGVRSAVRRGPARSAGVLLKFCDGQGEADETIRRGGAARMLSQRMRATVCSTAATIGNAAHTTTGAGSSACAAGHL